MEAALPSLYAGTLWHKGTGVLYGGGHIESVWGGPPPQTAGSAPQTEHMSGKAEHNTSLVLIHPSTGMARSIVCIRLVFSGGYGGCARVRGLVS